MTNNLNKEKSPKREIVIEKMPKIIFKLDDFVRPNGYWDRIDKLVCEEKIKVCIGIIGQYLEEATDEQINYIKEKSQSTYYEFFNHGYTHDCRNDIEFINHTFEEQLASLTKTQEICYKKTGVILHCFGSPTNAKDENTLKALEANSDITTWFFGDERYSKNNYKREIYMEKPFPVPSWNHIAEGLLSKGNVLDIIVLEGHPQLWYEDEWKTFCQIIKFLKNKNAEFVRPKEL